MDKIKGLRAYVASERYRKALELPECVCEQYELLAQGEYNVNYLFTHPASGQKLLLRVNCGSQMHLEDQIGYEYLALKLLEKSGRTPRPIYVDGSKELLEHGIMVMEFLPGRVLDYHKDMELAAACLADIHSTKIDEHTGLIHPEDPLRAILEECEAMVKTYMESPLGDEETKKRIRTLLDKGWKRIEEIPVEDTYCCCINTELNSTNFLINGADGTDYLIDWEKPLYGDPAQDLGHFLSPTTTFWKTDVILKEEEMNQFIDAYIAKVNGRFPTAGLRQRTLTFAKITCLRGITWCAMAWVEYQQPDKLIFNESTFRKLGAYLERKFLEQIEL